MKFSATAKYLSKSIDDDLVSRVDADAVGFLERQEACLQSLTKYRSALLPYLPPNKTVNPRQFLRAILGRLNLKIPGEILFRLDEEDNFEIWSFDMKLLGAGAETIRRLSYSLEDLLTKDWSELLSREPWAQDLIEQAISRLKQGEAYVDNVAPFHEVIECGGEKRSAWVRVKCVAIATNTDTGMPDALIGITTIRDHASID